MNKFKQNLDVSFEGSNMYIPADEHVAVPGELRVEELDNLHDEERVPLQTLFSQLRLHRHLVR